MAPSDLKVTHTYLRARTRAIHTHLPPMKSFTRYTAVSAALAAMLMAAPAAARPTCCQEQAGWPELWGISGSSCGSREATGCASGTWSEAQATCASIGARLCTRAEWQAQKVGCHEHPSFDLSKVWSADECGPHSHSAYRGNDVADDTCSIDIDTAFIACCTDFCATPTKVCSSEARTC